MRVINPPTVMTPTGGYSPGIRQTLANVAAVLDDAGATLADVVSTTVYVKDFSSTSCSIRFGRSASADTSRRARQ